MKLVWLIGSAAILFCCRVRAVSDSNPAKKQFLWDLNKSPPLEDESEQIERSPVSSTRLSNLGITRTRSPFAQKKKRTFDSLPEPVKDEECKHSNSCIHWKSLTRKEKHVVSNRIYRQNNPKSRERESLQKKRKYEQLSKEKKRELSIAATQRRQVRIAKMNEEQFTNYRQQCNKWQQKVYTKKMHLSTPEEKKEFTDKRYKENKRWRERKRMKKNDQST